MVPFLWIFIAVVFSVVVFLTSILSNARRLEKAAKKHPVLYQFSHDSSKPYILSQRNFQLSRVDLDVSLIIPCFNEESRILKTLHNVTTFFDGTAASMAYPLKYEVIVVDDGSNDKTIEVVQNYFRHLTNAEETLRIYKLVKNSGKGTAVTEGMLRARGAVCLFMDADDATEISEFQTLLVRLLQLLNVSKIDRMDKDSYLRLANRPGAVIGSRAHLQSKAAARRSIWRNFLTYGFHVLVWITTRTSIKDTQCGFKLFTRSAVHRIFPYVKIRRWCFDVEVLLLAKRNAIPVAEVPVKWTEIPGSKLRLIHIFHMAWELGTIFLGYTLLPSWRTCKSE